MLINNPNFKVSTIFPNNNSFKQAIDTNIIITFTKNIDKATISRNVIILKDVNKKLKTLNDLRTCKVDVVKGKFTLSDNIITFNPTEKLEYDSRYVVIVRERLTSLDLEPSYLNEDMFFSFYTIKHTDEIGEEEVFENPPTIVTPMDLSIVNKLDCIEWECNQEDGNFEIQISDDSEFNNLIIKDICSTKKYELDKYFDDGQYYIRVKSKKSKWSERHSLFLQNIDECSVTEEDRFLNDINDLLKEKTEEPLSFSIKNSNLINTKTKTVLIKPNRNIDIKEIKNLKFSRIKDIIADEEIYEPLDIISYSTVKHNNESYIALLIK